jgi:hypothetical protein
MPERDGAPAGLSTTVEFDLFSIAPVGNCHHDADSNQYYDSDHCPCHADAGQNTHFPERAQNTTDEHNITDKIHAGPFHDESPVDHMLQFDKVLLSIDRSIGWLFLRVKGYLASTSRSWRNIRPYEKSADLVFSNITSCNVVFPKWSTYTSFHSTITYKTDRLP